MKIVRGNREELDNKGAEIIKESINKLLKKQPHAVMAIPGGRSVKGIFDNLKKQGIPWDRVHIFMVDERLVHIDHEHSNYKQANEIFLQNLIRNDKLPKENAHPFIVDDSKHDYGISGYADKLKQYGGRYDLVLLGVGEDGHIGALFPNHHSVMDNAEFFLHMDDSPKPPPERKTLSRKLLLRSKVAIALFFGDAKRPAFEMFEDESLDYVHCPAKLILQIPESYVLTDLK